MLGPGVGWDTWGMDAVGDLMIVRGRVLEDVNGAVDCDCGSSGQQGAGGRGEMEGMNAAVVDAVTAAAAAVGSVGWAEVWGHSPWPELL